MNARLFPCLFVLVCLAACDQPEGPAPTPAPVTAPTAPTVPVMPPVSAPAPTVQPESVGEPVTATGKPAPALSRKTPAQQQVPPIQPPFEFDLHLPPELLDTVEPNEPLELEPLLPAFFGRESESDIRLNGRLIESLTDDRHFDGAEFKIEVRR